MEFVQQYKKSLCPDSFSRFLSKENSNELNEDVKEASKYLHSFVIPRLSETLIFEMHQFLLSGKDFSEFPLMTTVFLFSLFYFILFYFILFIFLFYFLFYQKKVHLNGVNARHLAKVLISMG